MIFLLLALAQLAAGFGVLTLFKLQLRPGLLLPLSVLTGIAVFSLVPFLLQLCHIPLTRVTVFTALTAVCLLLNIRLREGLARLKENKAGSARRLKLYELPFLALILFIVFVSVWRCFYFPPLSRDATSGPEAIAEYAFREHTLINSVFSVNLESNNNPFKPPYVISLQLIYKLAGFPFGQVWLSVIFMSFIVFLYRALSFTLHRLIAGLLILFFLAVPELYAYTFLILFDYSAVVYFFLSFYFLFAFFDSGQKNQLAFAGLLLGIATYARSETLVLGMLVLPLIYWQLRKQKAAIKTQAGAALLFAGPAVLVYIISIPLYINYYLPVKYPVSHMLNTHLLDIAALFKRWADMNRELIFSRWGIDLYGYFIFFFLLLLAAELIATRRIAGKARNWLYAILVVYLGLPLLGWLIPLIDLDNTTKRGLLKLFPLMLLYMANNGWLIRLSEKITKWEASS